MLLRQNSCCRASRDEDFSTTAVSSNGRWIATSLADNTVQLWDLEATESKMYSRVLEGPSSIITKLLVSPNDQWLVAGCRDSTAHVWNLSRSPIESSHFVLGKVLKSQDGNYGTLVIGPESRSVAISRPDGSVALWDLSAEKISDSFRSLPGHDSQVCAMAISEDWLVASALQDPQLKCWDLRTADPSPTAIDAGGHSFFLSIDDDSRWLAAGPSFRRKALGSCIPGTERNGSYPVRTGSHDLACGHQSRRWLVGYL